MEARGIEPHRRANTGARHAQDAQIHRLTGRDRPRPCAFRALRAWCKGQISHRRRRAQRPDLAYDVAAGAVNGGLGGIAGHRFLLGVGALKPRASRPQSRPKCRVFFTRRFLHGTSAKGTWARAGSSPPRVRDPAGVCVWCGAPGDPLPRLERVRVCRAIGSLLTARTKVRRITRDPDRHAVARGLSDERTADQPWSALL